MISISLFKIIPFAEVRLIKTKHVYYNVQCTLVLWVLTFSYMHLSLLIKETEIIKVIHVSSKFYGPGIIFMAPRHDATHSSMMTPISCPGGLSILSSCTQQHHHQQTPQGHRRGRRSRIRSWPSWLLNFRTKALIAPKHCRA